MADGVPAMMGLIQTMISQGLWTDNREDNFIDGGAPWYRCYTCADSKYVAVGAIEPQFFAELVRLLELDSALLKIQHDKSKWPEMHALFEAIFSRQSRDHWAGIFEGTDACVAPVLDFLEAEAYPHNMERQAFRRHNDVLQTSPAPRFDGSVAAPSTPGKATGADAEKILKAAGFDADAIKALATSGVLI